MNTALLIYLYLSLGSLLNALGFLLPMGLVVTLFVYLMICMDESLDFAKEMWSHFKPWVKRLGWGVAIVWLVSCFYPDKEDLAWIIGGTAAVSVASSEEAQKLPDNVLRAVNQFLEDVPDKEPVQE